MLFSNSKTLFYYYDSFKLYEYNGYYNRNYKFNTILYCNAIFNSATYTYIGGDLCSIHMPDISFIENIFEDK